MARVNIAGYTVSANPTAPNSLFEQDGGGGGQGVTFVPKLTETARGYELSWTNDGGLPNPDPVEITNGTDGTDGENGATFIPEITAVQGGHRLSWTNDGGKQNPDPVEIMNGTDGTPGADGENGATFVPSVTAVQGGHKLSWTNDKGLPNPPDVTILDGEGGEGGNVPAGGTAGQFLKKASAVDYATEWGTVHEIPAGGAIDQVLAKASAADFDLKWVTPSGGGGGGVWEVTEDWSQADYAILEFSGDLTASNQKLYKFSVSESSGTPTLVGSVEGESVAPTARVAGRKFLGHMVSKSDVGCDLISWLPIQAGTGYYMMYVKMTYYSYNNSIVFSEMRPNWLTWRATSLAGFYTFAGGFTFRGTVPSITWVKRTS